MGWSITPTAGGASIDANTGIANLPNIANVTYNITYTANNGCSSTSQYTVTSVTGDTGTTSVTCDCASLILSKGTTSLSEGSGSATIGSYTITNSCSMTNISAGAYSSPDSSSLNTISWGSASLGSNNTIVFTYNQNDSSERSAYVGIRGTINGKTCDQRIKVTQSAPSCFCDTSVTVVRSKVTFPGGASSNTRKQVATVRSGCHVEEGTISGWITVSQTGNNVIISVTENPSTTDSRTGVVSLIASNICTEHIVVVQEPNHDYVEIGGTKWATMNVGASSVTDYGYYFQWADNIGYPSSEVGSGEGKKGFAESDYKYGNSSQTSTITKYNSSDNIRRVQPTDDGARKYWGDTWRMPTSDEFQTLASNVTTAFTSNYMGTGVAGLVCTDKNDGLKRLFFPAAGYANASNISYSSQEGFYWSSDLNVSNILTAYSMAANGYGTPYVEWKYGELNRAFGFSIRPIKIS